MYPNQRPHDQYERTDRPPPHWPQQPREPHEQQSHVSSIGGRVVLDCNIDNANVRRTWRRLDGRPLSRYAQQHRNVLTIEVTTAADAGVYQCFEQRPGGLGDVLIVETEIVVHAIPAITFHPAMPLSVRAGDQVEIYCNVTGAEPIEVRWHAENLRPLPRSASVSGRYLQFDRIAEANAGRYYCTAANQYGNSTKIAEVLVLHSQVFNESPHRDGDVNVFEAVEGGTVKLLCTHDQVPRGTLVSVGRGEDSAIGME